MNKNILESYNSLPKTYQRIIDKMIVTMVKQAQKGKEKYGVTIDQNTKTNVNYWLNHLIEEQADSLVYLQKIIENSK